METPPLTYQPFDARVARDVEQLRVLAVLHYVGGGVLIAFASLFIVHVVIGLTFLLNPGAFGPNPPPAFFGMLFLVMGGTFVLLGWALGGLTIYSGRCIARRRRRTFSLVIAGVLCAVFPIGTALGVFALVVLLRDSVRAEYAAGPVG